MKGYLKFSEMKYGIHLLAL